MKIKKKITYFSLVFLLLLFFSCNNSTTDVVEIIDEEVDPNPTNILVETAEVVLVSGPMIGDVQSDNDEYISEIYKAIVDADDVNTNLDDELGPINVLLSVRYKKGTPLTNRWVLFDAGGFGAGYAAAFGKVTPGNYEEGNFYGDDLIRWYNEAGFVTVDIVWFCREAHSDDPCFDASEIMGWVEPPPNGEAISWMRNSGGTGYTGVSSRTRAVMEWAQTNNGNNSIGMHSHSSGSGRVITALTRYNVGDMLHSVVFDGGPVFAYIPWYCGVTDDGTGNQPGSLGPKPANYDIEAYQGGFRENFDRAADLTNTSGYSNCTDHVWDTNIMTKSSNFTQAAFRDFPNTNISVILGGFDSSPAPHHARLWFNGYSYNTTVVLPLSAKSVHIIQGYCLNPNTGTYFANTNDHSCNHWDSSLFPTANSVTYDATISNVSHSTTQKIEGATAAFNAMMRTLE